MFGVKRWGDAAVLDIDQAAVQARLEAWKRKVKEREHAKSSGEGQKASVLVSNVEKAVREDDARGGAKELNQSKPKRSGKRKVSEKNAHKARVGNGREGLKRERENGADERKQVLKLANGTSKDRVPQADNVVSDGTGGELSGPKRKKEKQAAADTELREAKARARAERRELKRQKEVERAHDIIAKKAKKGGRPIPQADNGPEQDEGISREERKKLKKQKREERRQGKDNLADNVEELSKGGNLGEETGLAGSDKKPHNALSEGRPEVTEARQAHADPQSEAEADGSRQKRKRQRNENAEEGDQEKIDEAAEQRKWLKPKGAPLEEKAQDADTLCSPEEGPVDGGDAVQEVSLEKAALPDKAPDPAPSKGPPLLPWMRAPIEIGENEGLELGLVPGLDVRLKGALKRAGIQELFPVQAAVWKEMVASGSEDHDLCVSAPTGSGKTFAYALPVCQGLSKRIVRRLRALVVLPTRDLASQVKAVFDLLTPALGLAVGLAVGQTSLAAEAQQLVSTGRQSTPISSSSQVESNVDILVCTPGRLMDHVHDTPGFTLQHLRYLVVDETDRLLRQAYQDWLPIVLSAASSPGEAGHVSTIRRPILERGIRTPVPRVVKLILSATLTRDPAKIQQLQLHRPLYITSSASDHRYKVPSQLQEFRLVCTAGEKPLYLIALLHQLQGQRTIAFTASVEATHRLFTLLQAFEGLPVVAGEYSSLQPQKARSAMLEAFRRGSVNMLVSSDAMTRGMDVENVENVISYDAPVYAKTYVHRAGRTARAGRPGRCFTLLRKEEVRHFKGLLRKIDNNYCPDYPLPASATDELVTSYTAALEKLKETVALESAGGGGSRQVP